MSLSTFEDRAAARQYYGVRETQPIVDGYNFDRETISLRELADGKGRVTRVRILKEGPYCDISYIHGQLGDGTDVRINVQVGSGRYFGLKGEFIAWAKEEGVYAKGLGLLDEGNWSVLNG